MSKKITINQNSLLAIKESMVGINDVSHNNVCVNEAAPEVDEFELGQESDNPPVGGNYAHVEENKLVTESKNSNRAHRQTRQIIARTLGTDENDPSVVKAEREFETRMFGEGKRVDWMIVLEPLAYDWYLQCENINVVQGYLDYIYLKGTESTPPSAYIAGIKQFVDFNELKQFLGQQKKADDAASMETQANMEVNLNQNYEVRGPLSFEDASEIGEYSNPNGQICYTQDEEIWDGDSYSNNDINSCYVLLRNDWQKVEANHDGSEANNGLPSPLNKFNGYDSYGLSMIFVWIGRFGNLVVSNTRWNHDADYAPGHSVDHALTELDIARLMGAPFEQVFGVKKIDIDDYVRKGLDSHVDIQDIFDEVDDEYCGLRCVKIGNKYNYVASENRTLYGFDYKYLYLLWDKPYNEWFEDANNFNSKTNLGIVEVNSKTYFIDEYAKLYDVAETTKKWLAYGKTDMFLDVDGDGAIVRVTYNYMKFNYVNTNDKKLLWDKPYEEWFDFGRKFRPYYDEYVLVILNNGLYFLDVNGNLSDITETVKKRLKVENPIYIFDTVENYGVDSYDIHMVKLSNKYNFINIKTNELLWDKPYDEWFDVASSFGYSSQDIAKVEIGNKHYFLNKLGQLIDTNGNIVESKGNKNILVSESRLKAIKENIESEVESSEIDLSSFKKRSELAPIWKDGNTLDSRVRLRLLDIADDFWEFVNLTWVKPSGIILTGSICNFNWSKYSDIDLHLIVDFDEIDEKTEFVQDYLDSKKNEWNNEHSDLTLMGFPVELYVQNLGDMPKSGGVYDLEENAWIKKPNSSDIKPIGLNKFSIKDKAAEIMTIIDDMYNALKSEDDMHKIEEIGEDAHYLWKKVKDMRQTSLEKNGESGAGNIVYKILRRMDYLDKLWKLSTLTYDKTNSIEEGKKIYISEDKLMLLGETQESNATKFDDGIFELAKKHFGVTHDIRECGYVLPDGSMLDFSGRHTLNPNTDSSHLRGRRGIDHREIYEIGWDKNGNVKNFDVSMEDFIRAGAVRVHVSSKYCSVNLYQKPTDSQIQVLINIIRYAKGCVDVEIGDGNESLSYAEYDGVNPRKPISDILRYFDDGINLVNESKEVLNEFLDNNYGIPLYRYFEWAEKASDREKVEDLFYHCPWIIGKYLSDVSRYDGELSDLEDELENGSDLEYDDEYIESVLDALEKHKLLTKLLDYPYTYAAAEELPAWFIMSFIRLVKNEWCIHFTSDANNIARKGFTGGTQEIENLAYTGAGRQKRGEGYDFAFLINDGSVDFNGYGDEAVIFRASGVLLFHYGDEQRQVVFWGPSIKEVIPIKKDDYSSDWVIEGLNGQVFATGKPSELADWATDNLPQYRNQILAGKSGYRPWGYSRPVFDNEFMKLPLNNESIKKYLTLLKEETVADGSSTSNPYKKRWKAERDALKNFIANYGKLMQSKEDDKGGKLYKVFYDKTMSELIGYNYCVAVQYDEINNKPKSTVYVRALDKFTPFIRRSLQYDTRGKDNQIGTMDDTRTPNYGAYGA